MFEPPKSFLFNVVSKVVFIKNCKVKFKRIITHRFLTGGKIK